MDHKGRDHVGEAPVDHKVPGVGQHGLVEPGHVPQQVVEAAASHPTCGLKVGAVEPLYDVGVVGDLEVWDHRVAEPLHLHVAAVVGPDGHGGVDDVGDIQQNGAYLLAQLSGLGGELLHLLGLGGDLGLHRVCFRLFAGVLFSLSHQHTDLLGQLVPVGPQGFGLLLGLQALLVQVDDLIHQRQFFLLKLVFDILLDNLGVIADKFDV